MESKKDEIGIDPKKEPIKLGSIVALNHHQFNAKINKELIVFEGDVLQNTPLMIITESLKEAKDTFDENTGINIINKDEHQYKCIWYSSKTGSFETAWFSAKLIVLIEAKENLEITSIKEIGQTVEFKTSSIESKKKKSTLSKNEEDIKNNYKITADLSFVSPLLQVIGTKNNEPKEPIFDNKRNEIIRVISSYLVKCKYYNSIANKFSEVLLPIEALVIVNKNKTEEHLKKIEKAIEDNSLMFFKHKSINYLFRANKIHYKGAIYYVKGFDYFTFKSYTLGILEIAIINNDLFFDGKRLPHYSVVSDKLKVEVISKTNIIRNFKKKSLYKIKYLDRYGNQTERIISNILTLVSDFKEDNKFVEYVKAFCFLRNAERYFRINRILEIIELQIDENGKKIK